MVEETEKEKLTKILQKLTSLGDIEGAALITRNGLLIASELSEDIKGETLAAMAAETAIRELKKSSPDRIIVESKNTKLIAMGAGKQAILTCIVNPNAQLGLVLMQMNKTTLAVKKKLNNLR